MFDHTYKRELIVWMAAMLAASVAMVGIARVVGFDSPWRGIALLPYFLAMVGVYSSELRQLARMDEFQRLIYLAGTLSGSIFFTTFCALAYAGEMLNLWPRVSPIWGIPAMGLGFLCGIILARRHYAE